MSAIAAIILCYRADAIGSMNFLRHRRFSGRSSAVNCSILFRRGPRPSFAFGALGFVMVGFDSAGGSAVFSETHRAA